MNASRTYSPKILVIDDDPIMLLMVSSVLKGHFSQIVTSGCPYQGLELAKSQSPDLVILDMIMPGLDGLQVLRAIRENESTRKTPVLMLTMSDQSETAQKAYAQGANGYLVKPIDPHLLNQKVSVLLAES